MKLFKWVRKARTPLEVKEQIPKQRIPRESYATEKVGLTQIHSLAYASSVARICIDSIASIVASSSCRVEGEHSEVGKQFVDKPNYNIETFRTFVYKLCQDALIYDYFIIEKVRSLAGSLYELYPRDASTFDLIRDKYGNVLGFSQDTGSGSKIVFDRKDVIFRVLHPSNKSAYGHSLLSTVSNEVAAAVLSVTSLGQSTSSESLSPGILALGKNVRGASYETAKENFKEMVKKSTGSRIMAVEGTSKDDIGFVPLKDATYESHITTVKDKIDESIFRAFGIPVAEYKGDSTMNIYEVQSLARNSRLIGPLMDLIEDAYNQEVFLNEGINAKLVFSRKGLTRFEAATTRAYVMSGVQSINDLRSKLGEADIPGGDQYYMVVGSDIYKVTSEGLVPAVERQESNETRGRPRLYQNEGLSRRDPLDLNE